jgi:hypothetical protein
MDGENANVKVLPATRICYLLQPAGGYVGGCAPLGRRPWPRGVGSSILTFDMTYRQGSVTAKLVDFLLLPQEPTR